MRRIALTLALTLSLTPIVTQASTVLGNPECDIVLTDAAQVEVVRLVAEECGTQDTDVVQVGATLEQWDVTSATLPDGVDYCALEVRVRWTPNGPLVDVPVDGFDVFTTDSSSATVEVQLHAGSEAATLVP